MNQEQVKNKLLELVENRDDFTVVFSGKKSKKVNGLYYPEKKEIIIHNKNFDNDNSMLYTAIHELAHHVHCSKSAGQVSSRSHTIEYKKIFHELLDLAEKKGIYTNEIFENSDFSGLTQKLKNNYILKNGQLMREFGELLLEAFKLCERYKVRFEDYVERVLQIQNSTAKSLIKVYSMNINPEIGFDNMKIVSRISDTDKRKEVENAFISGQTPETIKSQYLEKPKPEDVIERLFHEKDEIQKKISSLNKKLKMIEDRINNIENKNL